MDPKLLPTVLPIVIIAIVFALRFRNLNKPRPFNLGRLWLVPAILAVTVAFFLVTFPPTGLGWLIMGFAALIGAFAGVKRGQWMQLMRWTLWQRAKAVPPHSLAQAPAPPSTSTAA